MRAHAPEKTKSNVGTRVACARYRLVVIQGSMKNDGRTANHTCTDIFIVSGPKGAENGLTFQIDQFPALVFEVPAARHPFS